MKVVTKEVEKELDEVTKTVRKFSRFCPILFTLLTTLISIFNILSIFDSKYIGKKYSTLSDIIIFFFDCGGQFFFIF